MSIRIYDPTGTVETSTSVLAARPADLSGLRIAVLDNRKTNAGHLLTFLADQLAERYGAVRTVTVGKESAAVPVPEDAILKITHEADLVLTGSAD